jgi:hypothetical protein
VVVSADTPRGPTPALLDAGEQLLLTSAKVPVGESAEVQRARVTDLRSVPGARLGTVRVLRAEVRFVTRRAEAPAGWTREDPEAAP